MTQHPSHTDFCREAFDVSAQAIFALATRQHLTPDQTADLLRDTLRVTSAEATKIISGWASGKYGNT